MRDTFTLSQLFQDCTYHKIFVPQNEEKVLDFLKSRMYISFMENFEKPFLTQYCNLRFEWQCHGITADTATEAEREHLKTLEQQALAQSGLTMDELSLVTLCRKYRIITQVNTYAHKIKQLR